MAVAGNNSPVTWDTTVPVGSTTPFDQVDNIFRDEIKSPLKTFLERSHQAFSNVKAGEMLPGTAAPVVDTEANITALDADDYDGRWAWATDTLVAYIAADLGGGAAWHKASSPFLAVPTYNAGNGSGTLVTGAIADVTGMTCSVTTPATGTYNIEVIGKLVVRWGGDGSGSNSSLESQMQEQIASGGWNTVDYSRAEEAKTPSVASWQSGATVMLHRYIEAATASSLYEFKIQARYDSTGSPSSTVYSTNNASRIWAKMIQVA